MNLNYQRESQSQFYPQQQFQNQPLQQVYYHHPQQLQSTIFTSPSSKQQQIYTSQLQQPQNYQNFQFAPTVQYTQQLQSQPILSSQSQQITYQTQYFQNNNFHQVSTSTNNNNNNNKQQIQDKKQKEEETQLKIMNSEQLKKHWEAYSKFYTANIEKVTYFCLMSLYYTMNMDSASNVLEVACGGAYSQRFLSQQRPKYQKWTGTDISNSMLQIAYNRLKFFEEKPSSQINQYQEYEMQDYEHKDVIFNKFNVQLKFANNEDLSMFKDNEFDRYVSSCSLHLVENPDIQLKEAFRVLKSKGIAGICVWGRKKNSPFFTLVPEILQKYGVKREEDKQRSGFHIENKENLIKMAKAAGFVNISAWYQFLNTGPIPRMIPLDQCIDENQNELKATINQEIQNKLNEFKVKNKPIGIEFMYMVCEKP